jgi:quinol monooxygenase YgiN
MEKKTIVARVEVLPGKEEAFKKVAEGVIEGTRKEAGNISYNLYQNTTVPTMFVFYEEYKDEAAMGVHASSPYFKAFVEGIKDLLAKDMAIETY